MERVAEDSEREERISNEAVVDAYDAEEQALGWYYYLEMRMVCPFRAWCVTARRISPLRVGDEVEVLGMAPEDECEREMFVLIGWGDGDLAVPLAQLEAIGVDEETAQAIGDWHYWVARGYTF